MPQDKRRTISYRSFVTCDNPKGVVECGVIRKSKINSQKRDQQHQDNFKVVGNTNKINNNNNINTNNNIINNNNNKSLLLVNKEDKKEMCIQEITRELDGSNKGVHDMNHVNNSRSKVKLSSHLQRTYRTNNSEAYGRRLEQKSGREEIIAKDLLRGTLDLQESLVMFGRLQEEGFLGFMSKSRRKQKGNSSRSSFDRGSSFDGMVSSSAQKPRKSTDNGEMKKVVRDSLLRQNVITNPIFEENFVDHRIKSVMGSCSYVPSSSSSRSSSMMRSSNFVPSDSSSSASSISQRRLKRDSNLIIKLMGLESPPLSPRCHKDDEKIVNLRKCQYNSPQVYGKKQRSVEEILETLHFKGLLRSTSVNGIPTSNVDMLSMGNERYDERPPIVIMKPFMPKFWHESRVDEDFGEPGFCKAVESVNRDLKHRTRHEETLGNRPKIINQEEGRVRSKQKQVVSTSVDDHRKEEISKVSGHRKNRQSAFAEDNRKGKGKEKEINDVSVCVNNDVLPVAKSIVFDSVLQRKKPRVCKNPIRDDNTEALPEQRQIDKTPVVSDTALAETHEYDNAYDDSNSCYSEITSVSTSEHHSSSVCEVTLVTTHENGVPVDSREENSPLKESPRSQLRTLLLSNLSVLNNPEDLFNTQMFPDLVTPNVESDRVFIDYANEVLRRKSSEFSPCNTKEKQNLPSLDILLEEIATGIEDLKLYHRPSDGDEKFCSDTLYLILERDLRSKNGIWGVGWMRTFSRDEFELVVRDVEKIILGKLIEEVVLDFMVI